MSLDLTPQLTRRDLRIFERAYREGNHLRQMSLAVDERVRQLQLTARQQPSPHNVDFSHQIAIIEDAAAHALEQEKQSGAISWTDYFRLFSQVAFLEQRIMLPLAFEHTRDHELHKYLTNGIYGINGNILERELTEYSNCRTEAEGNQLRGAIHEQTQAALINRGDRKRHVGLPADTSDDLHRKVDVDYWRLLDKNSTYDHIRIQVKSSRHDTHSDATPLNGIVMTARDMFNLDLRAAHLIVKELNNELIVDPERSIDEKNELETIQSWTMRHIDAKYNAV